MKLRCLKPRLDTTAPSVGWKPDTERGNRHQRGYGYAWQKTRDRIRERATGLCEPHLAEGFVHMGCECDHVVPKAQGGSDNDENLQWVCLEYHKAKTARESRGGG